MCLKLPTVTNTRIEMNFCKMFLAKRKMKSPKQEMVEELFSVES